MQVQVDEVWVSSGHLVMRVVVWGDNGTWRQKRYAHLPIEQIPDEVVTDLIGHWMDAQPEEDPKQDALF